jgi:hypothetical protein
MSIKAKMLETEFPLSGGNPKMRRSSSTKDTQVPSTPLNRQISGSARKVSTNSTDLREPLMASEWQYESARSMSRIQTSFDRSGSVSREQGVQANLPKVWKSNVRSASLNRTASLRKACSDESSDVDVDVEVDEEDHERTPLKATAPTSAAERPTNLRPTVQRPTSQVEQTTPSSTSDYHSDDVHQHRRTNSFHGGSTRFGQPVNPVAVESNPVKWQTMR